MSKNKTPSAYPIELQWDTLYGPLKVWAKPNLIPSDVYTIAWDIDGLAVRADDIELPNMPNAYDIWWKAYHWYNPRWVTQTAKDRGYALAMKAQLQQLTKRTDLVPTYRFTVVPLRFLGHLCKLMRRDMYVIDYLPNKKPEAMPKLRSALSRWSKVFSDPMITLRKGRPEHDAANTATTLLNEQLTLPEPNATDMLMAPQKRTLFPIQGAAVLHFSFTFNVPRTKLYALCALLNPSLKDKNAALMLPDLLTGGNGNSLVLTVELPFVCNGFPLVSDGEYPNAASHDMAYEAVRKAEALAQQVYESLALKLEANDAEEQRAISAAL